MTTIREQDNNRRRTSCGYPGKLSGKRGFTMAEMLGVVAIIIILAAVAFIAVMQHQRNLAQLERDNTAKEIFLAAQNHLLFAEGEGYPGLTAIGDIKDLTEQKKETICEECGTKVSSDWSTKAADNIFYITVNNSFDDDSSGYKMYDLMLPFGAIDETVRTGGSYIIRYNRAKGQVLDVFYCSTSGTRFDHNLTPGNYSTVMNLRDLPATHPDGPRDCKKDRKKISEWDNAVLGWYGGGAETSASPTILKTPKISVKNADRLTVTIDDVNYDVDSSGKKPKTLLLVTGVSSGAKKFFRLERESDENVTYNEAKHRHTVVLDDITTSKRHFADLFPITGNKTATSTGHFIPGENLIVQAIDYSNEFLATIQYSAEKTTNSLFWNADTKGAVSYINTAYINNIRHLENLDAAVSRLNDTDAADRSKLMIEGAEQLDDLIWTGDTDTTAPNYPRDFVSRRGGSPQIHYYNGDTELTTDSGYYLPVDLDSILYNGNYHSVSKIAAKTNTGGNSGMFGELNHSAVSDLKLIDFNISGANAGALAGSFIGATVTLPGGDNQQTTTISNVIAHNSSSDAKTGETRTIKGTGSTGGLIGSVTDGKLAYCGASVTVSGSSGYAGGLVGSITNSSGSKAAIDYCFSGGHTDKGEFYWHKNDGKRDYDKEIYNVQGGTAGGLVGTSSAPISHSYSTCSVKGTSKAGGFAGNASAAISKSYCAGMVATQSVTNSNSNSKNRNNGGFAGSMSAAASDCCYFEIASNVFFEKEQTSDPYEVHHCLGAVGDGGKAGISAFDAEYNPGSGLITSAQNYDRFVGKRNTWAPANAYDKTLRSYYRLKFNFRTVNQLNDLSTKNTDISDKNKKNFVNTHYGDWPAPEVFVINQ